MEEQLRKDLLMAVAKILGEDTANRLEVAFTMVLYKYKLAILGAFLFGLGIDVELISTAMPGVIMAIIGTFKAILE